MSEGLVEENGEKTIGSSRSHDQTRLVVSVEWLAYKKVLEGFCFFVLYEQIF